MLYPTKKMIAQRDWDLLDKLLREEIPIAGLERVTEILEVWLQKYINKKYEDTPKEAAASVKKRE